MRSEKTRAQICTIAREKGNEGTISPTSPRLHLFEERREIERSALFSKKKRERGGGGELLPIVVRTDINVGKKAREEG